jgi:beta-mannanase
MSVNAILLTMFSGGVLYFTVGGGFRSDEAAARVQQTQNPTASASLGARIPTKQQVLSPRGQYFGLSTPQAPWSQSEIDGIASKAGERPSMLEYFNNWTEDFRPQAVQAAYEQGTVPVITWEPWAGLPSDPSKAADQPTYALSRIIHGAFDGYITKFATAMRDQHWPIGLRFGHEMNGNWYPWSEQVNGNSSGDYAAAWQHVHSVVTAAGATNVSWVWNPNVPYWGSVPLGGLYPGAAYVDAVALDGYNWGTSASWSTWASPSQLFGDGLSQLRALAPGKQILIAETSSAEQGGSKADWITALVSYLAGQPDITALTWFHYNKETDWRINSSTSSAEAFRRALASRR